MYIPYNPEILPIVIWSEKICTCEPEAMYKNVYYIFVITKKLEITLCPTDRKWFHCGVKCFTAVKGIDLKLHGTSWINFRNKMLRRKKSRSRRLCVE